MAKPRTRARKGEKHLPQATTITSPAHQSEQAPEPTNDMPIFTTAITHENTSDNFLKKRLETACKTYYATSVVPARESDQKEKEAEEDIDN
ncbi:hypothetical protein VTH82DRAFT_5440 [Thermothelomyces myriococcoides]